MAKKHNYDGECKQPFFEVCLANIVSIKRVADDLLTKSCMNPNPTTPKTMKELVEDALFASIVAVGVREEGTITDLDTLIIDRQKAVDLIVAAITQIEEECAPASIPSQSDFADGYVTGIHEFKRNLEARRG